MIESNVLVEVSHWSISLVKLLQQNTKTQHLSEEQARWAREKESKVSFSFQNQMRFRVDLWVCRAVLELNFLNIENISKSTAHAMSDF